MYTRVLLACPFIGRFVLFRSVLYRRFHCIFLTAEKLFELATEAGFEVASNGYIQKETVNHKEQICAPRVFLQARLRKPCKSVV